MLNYRLYFKTRYTMQNNIKLKNMLVKVLIIENQFQDKKIIIINYKKNSKTTISYY